MLDGIPIGNLSAAGLLAITVLLLLLGRIVPRSTLTDKSAECDKWQKAYEVEREARIHSDIQTSQLLELAKTTNNIVIAAFGANTIYRQSEGEAHVASKPTKD